jgi:ABC-2 type transport system permease protein
VRTLLKPDEDTISWSRADRQRCAGAAHRLAPRGRLALCLVIGFFGQLLDLPDWVRDLALFQHVPSLPSAGFDAVPLVILTVVAGFLVVGGVAALRQRDLTT